MSSENIPPPELPSPIGATLTNNTSSPSPADFTSPTSDPLDEAVTVPLHNHTAELTIEDTLSCHDQHNKPDQQGVQTENGQLGQHQQQTLHHGRPRSATTMTYRPYIRPRATSQLSRANSVHSYVLRANSRHNTHQVDLLCEFHDHYGPTAYEEEKEALAYAAELAAARLARKDARSGVPPSGINVSIQQLGSGVGNGVSERMESGNSHNQDTANALVEEDSGEEAETEEENDHCLSGVCLPKSQFFQTSIICSNTMARDSLANERTFLAWLNMCTALCIVAFSFLTRTFTLDSLEKHLKHDDLKRKDRISIAIGYTCFIAAVIAIVYSLLKYLRNIRRISTRYPFVQAGLWTFSVGMILGTLIMVALVLAYTERL